ncbi:MAG: hypothetical protein FWD68_16305 [Alphaproteobacteria bacterium]|nr:hypothetical protein [Alphaproteobacteria bacterium]
MEQHEYRYAGPPSIRHTTNRDRQRFRVAGDSDLRNLLENLAGDPHLRGVFTITYVIDRQAELWIADRRSEHFDCAAGGRVLAAGEIGFDVLSTPIAIAEITNQSTGYCPEPGCWRNVAAVLDRLRIPHPPCFTSAFEFRRCDACGATNLIKEELFECALCGAALSRSWNFYLFQKLRCRVSRRGHRPTVACRK